MTSVMKVYGKACNTNVNKTSITANYAGVSIDIQDIALGSDNRTAEYLSKFPFGKIPAMDCAEGPLYESNALAFYLAAKHAPALLGQNAYEQAQVVQYICSVDCELVPAAAAVIYPMLGLRAYNSKEWKTARQDLLAKLKIYDGIIMRRTFLVGHCVTLADIIVGCHMQRLFSVAVSSEERAQLGNIVRWIQNLSSQSQFSSVWGSNWSMCTEVETPSKSSSSACGGASVKCDAGGKCDVKVAEKKSKAAPKVEEGNTNGDDYDDEEKPVKVEKQKNEFDLLPATSLNLEAWKRYYSNADETRPDATNWFWEHYDPTGYSIWRADYKYNEELRKIFMTCNLITGLFHRMDHLRKYIFASVAVFGEDDNNSVTGVFVVRGTEMPEMLKDVPDYEVYEWTRMNTEDPQQRELINDYFAWEGEFEGRKFADGKIFK